MGKTAALKVDAEGNVKYDMIIRQNMRKGMHVATSYLDLMEKHMDDDELSKPSLDAQQALAEKTRQALGQAVETQIRSAQPNNVKKESKEPTYIRYTPAQQSVEHNSGAQQRIIKLQNMPTDPLEPPQFKHKKMPQGPPSPPVPIMHSPTRKITVHTCDSAAWTGLQPQSPYLRLKTRPTGRSRRASPIGRISKATRFPWTSAWRRTGEVFRKCRSGHLGGDSWV